MAEPLASPVAMASVIEWEMAMDFPVTLLQLAGSVALLLWAVL